MSAISDDLDALDGRRRRPRRTPTHRHLYTGEMLTRRQRQVLTLYAEGNTLGDVADMLGISRNSVKKHVEASRRNLEARTIAQAVAIALRRGLIQ